MANELPEVGAFNQQPTLADIGKSSAATSLGSIGSLINLLTAKNTTDNLPEYMNILSPDFKPSATDLPDIEYFKEMFGAPETLNIGDFVSIDPVSKVLAGGKGIMAMVPFINKDGLNVTKLLETIRQIKNRATSTRNAARSSENINLKEAEYRAADKIDLEAKKLESQITSEDLINEKNHRAAQSSKEESNKALAEIRKNLGIDPKKKQFEELARLRRTIGQKSKKSKGDKALDKAIVAERKKDPSFDDKISYYNYLTIEKNMTDPAKIAEKMKLFVPGKSTKMKKGGFVDKALYTDQKYI